MSSAKFVTDKTGHYRVDYEYARMREVVLGGTALMLPPKGTVFDKYIEELYPDEETREFLRSLQGTPLNEAHPEYHQRMVDETNALAAIFEHFSYLHGACVSFGHRVGGQKRSISVRFCYTKWSLHLSVCVPKSTKS